MHPALHFYDVSAAVVAGGDVRHPDAPPRPRPPSAMLARVLPVDLETLRLFLHILAATVWVGGQLVLAALVPALRAAGADVPRAAARAFNRVAWPAFGVLLLTGVWNVVAEGDRGAAYRHTLVLKLVLVVTSGATAWAHARAKTRAGLAAYGALTGISALAALLVGVVLAR